MQLPSLKKIIWCVKVSKWDSFFVWTTIWEKILIYNILSREIFSCYFVLYVLIQCGNVG